jgi:hypothetical protein
LSARARKGPAVLPMISRSGADMPGHCLPEPTHRAMESPTKLPDTITHIFVHHNGWPGSIVSPEDGQGTSETCRYVLNKITTISVIKLDTYILFYDARNHEPKIVFTFCEVTSRFSCSPALFIHRNMCYVKDPQRVRTLFSFYCSIMNIH